MADTDIVQQALDRGYSLDEIADKLSTSKGLDPADIRARGYGSNEILGRLGYTVPEAKAKGNSLSDVASNIASNMGISDAINSFGNFASKAILPESKSDQMTRESKSIINLPGSVLNGQPVPDTASTSGVALAQNVGPMRQDFYDATKAAVSALPIQDQAKLAAGDDQVATVARSTLDANSARAERAARGDLTAQSLDDAMTDMRQGYLPEESQKPYDPRRGVDIGEAAARGLGEGFSQLGFFINALPGAGAVAWDAAKSKFTGQTEDAAKDWYYNIFLKDADTARDYYAIKPDEALGFASKLAYSVGSFVPDMLMMAITGGANEAPAIASKIPSISQLMVDGATTTAPVAIKNGMQRYNDLRAQGATEAQAGRAALVDAMQFMMFGASPAATTGNSISQFIKGEGTLAGVGKAMLSGAPIGAAFSQLSRTSQNIALSDRPDLQTPFNPEDLASSAVQFGLLGAVLHHADAPMPERAGDLGYFKPTKISEAVSDVFNPNERVQAIQSAKSVDEAIGAAKAAVSDIPVPKSGDIASVADQLRAVREPAPVAAEAPEEGGKTMEQMLADLKSQREGTPVEPSTKENENGLQEPSPTSAEEVKPESSPSQSDENLPPAKEVKQPGIKPAPIMQRKDLVGAIMRATDGKGISSDLALTITGDTANNVTKLRGLFTKGGTLDLSDIADTLRNVEGFDVKDGPHLEELIRQAAAGDKILSMQGLEESKAAEEERAYRQHIYDQADEMGIRRVARKFTAIEQEVLKLSEQRLQAEIEKAGEGYQAMREEALGHIPEEEVDQIADEVFDKLDGKPIHEMYNAITDKLKEAIDARQQAKASAGKTESTDGADIGAGSPEAESRPGLELAGQSEAEARADAERLAKPDEGITKEQIDREATAPFTLDGGSQAKTSGSAPVGGQSGLFTADGRTTKDARNIPENIPDSLEGRHATLDPKIDALTDDQAVAVGKELGIEYKRGEDIREKIKQSHPDDQERALTSLQGEKPEVASEAEPKPLPYNPENAAKEAVSQAAAIEPAKVETPIEPIGETQRMQAVGQEARIQDFGEKIGGARKDTAVPLGPRRMSLNTDERPAWARKYHAMQISDTARNNPGKWQVMVESGTMKGAVRPISGKTFDTEQEALNSIPLAAVSRNHRVYSYDSPSADGTGTEKKWGIYRNITDRKRALVKGGFDTYEDAMKDLATNPVPIIEHKFPFPERPWLDRIERIGAERRAGDVSTRMFQDTFGFRAGEFGNWNMGGDGQAALNHAYDALMDFADILGIPPKALSLNGQLAIAFGARGTGGIRSAAAHYEPSRLVINLTKIKGAGSLAHEWWHAVDHYFARNGGYSDSHSVISDGFKRTDSSARPELIAAIKNVMDTISHTEKSSTTDADIVRQNAQKRLDSTYRDFDYKINDIRRDLTDPQYRKKKTVPTKDQLAQFDSLVEKLRNGDAGPEVYVEPSAHSQRVNRLAMGFTTNENIKALNDIYKAVTGRGFLKSDPTSSGRQFSFIVKAIADNKGKLDVNEAQTHTYKGRTEFYLEARKIDGYRASDYWSTPEEMGARAFESYVFDKLTGENQQSDYLVHGVDNRYYALLDMKPYPEGDERKAIDAAFDNLFKTINAVPTEKGVALESRAADHNTDETRARVGQFWMDVAKNPNAFRYGAPAHIGNVSSASEIATKLSREKSEIRGYEIGDSMAAFHSADGNLVVLPVLDGPRNEEGGYRDYMIQSPGANSSGKIEGGGSKLYQAAQRWIVQQGGRFVGDGKLSEINKLRVTSNMLSSALREGSTDHLVPDPEQHIIGWRDGDTKNNIGALALREMELVHERVPGGLPESRGDDASGVSSMGEGRLPFRPDAAIQALSRIDPDFSRGVGEATYTRALATKVWGRDFRDGAGSGLSREFGDRYRPLYSRSSESNGVKLSASDTQHLALVNEVRDKFLNGFKGAEGLDIRVVWDRNQIPEGLRPSPYAEGVYHDRQGLVYLIASKVTPERAGQVLLHEAVGHYGLSHMMGDKFEPILGDVLRVAKSAEELTYDPEVGDKNYATVDAVRLRYPDAPDDVVAQEVLARMAETGTGNKSVFQIALARVRNWMREMAESLGFKREFTLDDAKDLVTIASDYLRRGENLSEERGGEDMAFASRRSDQIQTPEFKRWFGDSKVVDTEGKPLVVYHGTAADISYFDPLARGTSTQAKSAQSAFFFSASQKVASGYAMLSESRPGLRVAVLENAARSAVLTPELQELLKREAEKQSYDQDSAVWIDHAGGGISDANVLPVYLDIKNPLVVDYHGESYRERTFAKVIQEAKEAGHDGVIFRNAEDSAHKSYSEFTDIYAAFRPEQIKSATGNRGTFNPDSANILESRATPADVIRVEDKDRDQEPRSPLNPINIVHKFGDTYSTYVGVEREKLAAKGSIGDSIAKILVPAERDAAVGTAGIIRSNLAEQARTRELAQRHVEEFAKMFDKMPVEENYRFIDAMERGVPLKDPMLAKAAIALRKVLDQRRDEVIALGKGNLENFNENYFPHIWKDPTSAANFFSRRPLEGGKGFLKQRTYDFFSDGLKAGLEPVTTNPVELALIKAREMDRYIYGQRIFQQMKEAGFAKFVGFGDKPPEGWEKINDRIARVYSSSAPDIEKAADLASHGPIPKVVREALPKGNLILRGEYYAPEAAATLINNHLSPGLSGIKAFDVVRKAGNFMNACQLGLSAFHLGFTTLDAMISKAALGIKQASRGDIAEGAGNVLQSLNPAQPLLNLYKGDKLLKAYMGNLNDPDMAQIVDALVQGGGRVKMDDIYRNQGINEFKQALRKGNYGTAALKALPTLMDKINKPIFEYLVPRQKLGVFFDMAKDALENNPDMDLAEKQKVMGKLWDSVDNRMGELVYDNVFWNRALKDALMVSTRSVGWNLGTFREIGGGVKDVAKIKELGGLSDRTAYIFGLTFVSAVIGSITQYMLTGKGPEELKDVFFPKTGKIRPDGTEDRLSLPTYMKDIAEYYHDLHGFVKYGDNPFHTVQNKVHPLLATIGQVIENKDFFGGAIRSPGDTPTQQALDYANYALKQITPFGIRNYEQQAKLAEKDPGILDYIASPQFIGITPAPGYITKTDEEAESSQVNKMHDSLVAKFREEIRDGADWSEIRERARAAGITSPQDLAWIRKSAVQKPPKHLKSFGN